MGAWFYVYSFFFYWVGGLYVVREGELKNVWSANKLTAELVLWFLQYSTGITKLMMEDLFKSLGHELILERSNQNS